jgi:polynucleotide 5'-hydroxyl-kinase GRC3/NOL9
MNSASLHVPDEWQKLELENLSGVLLVIGAPDSGKTTFARYLFRCLEKLGRRVAFIDGDPGQSVLGPPTTVTLTFEPDRLSLRQETHPADTPRAWRYFIGSTSPQGHMLPVVVGSARLVQTAQSAGAQVVVYDTSGLIDPALGGLALKNAKIELLRPQVVFAIQQEYELEALLRPLRRSRRAKVVEMRPSPAVMRRDASVRREHRMRQFAGYFAAAGILELAWTRFAIYPYPAFSQNRLVALEDQSGFTLGLGIVVAIDHRQGRVRLLTPLESLKDVNAIRLGDVLLSPETFKDERIVR